MRGEEREVQRGLVCRNDAVIHAPEFARGCIKRSDSIWRERRMPGAADDVRSEDEEMVFERDVRTAAGPRSDVASMSLPQASLTER